MSARRTGRGPDGQDNPYKGCPSGNVRPSRTRRHGGRRSEQHRPAAPAPLPEGEASVYEPSPIKRVRRTKDGIEQVKTAIYATLEADHPQTVRGLFYQLVSQGVVPKTEAAYKTLVGRLCVQMRRSGALPFTWLGDNTRWMRRPTTFSSLEDALRRTAETYRRALWDELPTYVEVWLEKDALAGVVLEETAAWDVPLMVTRGYPSLSFLYSAAEQIRAIEKPVRLYYLGDHDPSGVDIPRKVERDLRAFAPGADITLVRLAVTPEQIARYGLPTRPTKATDSRARHFTGGSVEVDAIPARTLRGIVHAAITAHIDPHQLRTIEVAEASERHLLAALAATDWQPHLQALKEDSPHA